MSDRTIGRAEIARALALRAVDLAERRELETWSTALRDVRQTVDLDVGVGGGLLTAVSHVGWEADAGMPALAAAFCGREDGRPPRGYARLADRECRAGRDVAKLWHVEVERLRAWAAEPGAANRLRLHLGRTSPLDDRPSPRRHRAA